MLATHCRRILVVLAPVLGLVACSPSFSPPIRSSHYGAAGRTKAGELEIGGAGNLFGTGGPNVGYAATDSVAIEGGGEFAGGDNGWQLGYAGVRLTYNARERDADGALAEGPAVDGAVGFGAGRGGAGEEPPGFAAGGYIELGASVYAPMVIAGFTRARFQGSKADGAPPTMWWSALAGAEFWYGPVALYVATGGVGYQNTAESMGGWYPIEGGMFLHFDVAGGEAAAPATSAAR